MKITPHYKGWKVVSRAQTEILVFTRYAFKHKNFWQHIGGVKRFKTTLNMPVVTPSVSMEVSSNACVGPRADCSGLLSCHTALRVCLWDLLVPDAITVSVIGCSIFLWCQPARQPSYHLQLFLPLYNLPSSALSQVFFFLGIELFLRASQMVLVVKNPSANAEYVRDVGSVPGSGRSPGGGHGNALQYCCLENLMDRKAWWATVHRVTKSRTWLKWLNTRACSQHTHIHTHTHTHIHTQLFLVWVIG